MPIRHPTNQRPPHTIDPDWFSDPPYTGSTIEPNAALHLSAFILSAVVIGFLIGSFIFTGVALGQIY